MNNELQQLYNDYSNKVNKLREDMQALAEKMLSEAFSDALEKAPEIDHFFWTQYTPYFNDGENCEFSVGECYFILTTDLELEDDYYVEGSYLYSNSDLISAKNHLEKIELYFMDSEAWIKKYGSPYWRLVNMYTEYNLEHARQHVKTIEAFLENTSEERVQYIQAIVSSVQNMVYSIDEDIMKTAFGDHVRVKVSRKGVEIDEYEHD